jgi:phosphopantothenoylcysteine synthetase/decarboxylase
VNRDMDEEFVTHAALVEHLRQFRQEGVVFFHPPSGEERTKRVHPKTGKVFCPGGTRLQRMGMRKGAPDLVILHSGRIMGLEVKSPDGMLSREQKEFRAEWVGAGGLYAVVRSVKEGIVALEAWGVVTTRGAGLDKLKARRRENVG